MRTCETESNGKSCGKPAIAKVRLKKDKMSFFNVCEECLPAYEYVMGKEFGNTESGFIVKKFSSHKEDEK